MKKILIPALIIFASTVAFAQIKCDSTLTVYIDSLYRESTQIIPHHDTIFSVCDRVTGTAYYRDKKYSNNDAYKLFRFIVNKASTNDLLYLTYSKYPNLAIYGYWGLLLKKKKNIAAKVCLRLKGDQRKIHFVSFGDLIQTYTVNDLVEYLNKNGRK